MQNVREALALMIPIRFIHGTQGPEDYKKTKEVKVVGQLKENPSFLHENPIELCVLELETGLVLALWDGHHRVRACPKFKIHTVPSFLYSLELLASMRNQDPEQLKAVLLSGIADTTRVFGRIMALRGKFAPKKDVLPIQSLAELERIYYNNPTLLEQFGISRLRD